MPNITQITNTFNLKGTYNLISGALNISDVSLWNTISVGSPTYTVKVILQVYSPTGQLFYQNAGYLSADFTSPDINQFAATSYSATMPTTTSGDYITGQYIINAKVQVVDTGEGGTTEIVESPFYNNVFAACAGIIPNVTPDVTYGQALVTVTDNTQYGNFFSLANQLTLYPPLNASSPQSTTFSGAPATLVWAPPMGQFPYIGTWQWKLNSTVTYLDPTGTQVTCFLSTDGMFQVEQSPLCIVRCQLDKYLNDFWNNRNVGRTGWEDQESNFVLAEGLFTMALASERCGVDTTKVNSYITKIYAVTGIDPTCDCGCGNGTQQQLIPTSSINGTNGTNGLSFRQGSGVPSGGLGIVGDSYVDSATGNVYLKTGATTWAFEFNIEGAQGDTGSAGQNGADGANGIILLFSDNVNHTTPNTSPYTFNTVPIPANTFINIGDTVRFQAIVIRNYISGTPSNIGVFVAGSTIPLGIANSLFGTQNIKIIIDGTITMVSENQLEVESSYGAYSLSNENVYGFTGASASIKVPINSVNFGTVIPIQITGQSATAGDLTEEFVQAWFMQYGTFTPLPPSSVIQTVMVNLSSAQILNLFSTPVVLVPAQGVNTVIQVISTFYKLSFNTTPYNTNTIVAPIIAAISVTNSVNILGANANEYGFVVPGNDFLLGDAWVNASLKLVAANGNPIGGDSTLEVQITYQVLNV